MLKFSSLLFIVIAGITLISCDTNSLFGPSGSHFSGPIAVAVDTTRNRAYVVNSNNIIAYTDATLSILDLSNPAAPVLLSNTKNPISIPNFSGQIYLNTVTQQAFVSNRLSDNNDVKIDHLLRINVNESPSTFAAVDSFTAGDNPFGITCCDTSSRLYAVSNGGTLDVFDSTSPATLTQVSLAGTLASGEIYTGTNSTEATLLGNQVFVSNRAGRIFVINTTEVGDSSKHPIDYIILNMGDLRGITTDGTLLYVVDATTNAEVLRIINPASLTAVSPDSSTPTEKDFSTVQTATVSVGHNPNEVTVFKGKAYVSNQNDNTVSVIDLTSKTVTATISVGQQPFGLTAFTLGTTDYLYVTNLFSNSISVVDLSSNTVVNTLTP